MGKAGKGTCPKRSVHGIVLLGEDKSLQKVAKGKRIPVAIDEDGSLPLAFDRTLFVEPGTEVPWDLLPAAWYFLERWDAAVPLWRYAVTAADVGKAGDRKRTEAVIRDLRVLVHSVELLFVRDNEDGRALMEAYRRELADGGDKRLAFLRAYYQTKPRLCVLPRTWRAAIYQRSKMDVGATRGKRHTGPRLVELEVAPGRFVKCHPGDEEKVLERFRGGRRMDKRPLVKVKKKKRRKPAEDKMRRPEADKQIADCRLQIADGDDFSTIRGIGAVTAGRLQERGIFTFEQLRTADVRGLPGHMRRAIKIWRESDGRQGG